MHYFLDTSALAKLYIQEPGTERMVKLAESASGEMTLLSLAEVEFHAALQRRKRMGDLDAAQCADLLSQFQAHQATVFVTQIVSDAVIKRAVSLLDRHDLRAYDALQLAGCLSLRPAQPRLCFVCADRQLLGAAMGEGLQVFDPVL